MDRDTEMEDDTLTTREETTLSLQPSLLPYEHHGDYARAPEGVESDFNEIIRTQYIIPLPYISHQDLIDLTEDRRVPLEQFYGKLCNRERSITESEPEPEPGPEPEISKPKEEYSLSMQREVAEWCEPTEPCKKNDLIVEVTPNPIKLNIDIPLKPLPEIKRRNTNKTKDKDTKKKKRSKNPKKPNVFISFFLSMYSRRPSKRAADVARQAGRQWCRMSDQQKRRFKSKLIAKQELEKSELSVHTAENPISAAVQEDTQKFDSE